MGDPGRRHKKYMKPKKRFETQRMDEENVLLKRYGLKNKKEIWKAEFKIGKIRRRAKSLIRKPEEQMQLISKLKALGFKVSAIDDVLALTKEDLLERRLQTILVKRKIAKTPKGARQLITHKYILVNGSIVNIPSFLVPINLEDKINIRSKPKTKKEKPEIQKNEN